MIINLAAVAIVVLLGVAPPAADAAPGRVLKDKNGPEKRRLIVTLVPQVLATPAACQEAADNNGGGVVTAVLAIINACALELPPADAGGFGTLSADPNVLLTEEDTLVSVSNWGLDRINQAELPLDGVSEKVDASGVKVFILDTGIQGDHEDFIGSLDRSSNCHADYANENDPLVDGHSHGTHVASTACGNTYGVAENCELCAVKVLAADGYGYTSWSVNAISNIVANHCSAGEKCVINMSLGQDGNSASEKAAIDAAFAAGVVTVVAAGNNSDNACNYSPAFVDSAITVGSTTVSDSPSSFTNYGTCTDVYAPGSSILAAHNTGSYTYKSGTSMASPQVAGIAAGHLAACVPAAEVKNVIVGAAVKKPVHPGSSPAGVGIATWITADAPTCTTTPTDAPSSTPTEAPSSVPVPTMACTKHTECTSEEKCKGHFHDKNNPGYTKKCRKHGRDCKNKGTKSTKRWGCVSPKVCGAAVLPDTKWGVCA